MDDENSTKIKFNPSTKIKTIIDLTNEYSNDKYILLQQVADSNNSTNREEPFAGDKNKKFSIVEFANLVDASWQSKKKLSKKYQNQ